MARVFPTLFIPTAAGVQLTYSAPAGTGSANADKLRPGQVLLVKNGSASPLTLTIETGGTTDGLAIADPTITIPAGQDYLVGPFDTGSYPQISGAADEVGTIFVQYGSVTSITRALIGRAY